MREDCLTALAETKVGAELGALSRTEQGQPKAAVARTACLAGSAWIQSRAEHIVSDTVLFARETN